MTARHLTKPAKNTGTVSVKLDASDKERLNSLAVARKRTSHYLMKEAIQEYIKREEINQNFIRASEASDKHAEKTGLHVTSQEVDAWVKSLKSDPTAKIPKCHI